MCVVPSLIRWLCGVSMKDRKTSEELRELVGVEPITTVIKSGRLRWYEHVMRKIVVMGVFDVDFVLV